MGGFYLETIGKKDKEGKIKHKSMRNKAPKLQSIDVEKIPSQGSLLKLHNSMSRISVPWRAMGMSFARSKKPLDLG